MIQSIAIFTSDSVQQSKSLIHYLSDSKVARVKLVVRCQAGNTSVSERSPSPQVTVTCLNTNSLSFKPDMLELLEKQQIHWVVVNNLHIPLPEGTLQLLKGRVINLIPSLQLNRATELMFGPAKPQKVKIIEPDVYNNRAGITGYLVGNHFDEGEVMRQESCPVFPDDTAENIQERIKVLAYCHYPTMIERACQLYAKTEE